MNYITKYNFCQHNMLCKVIKANEESRSKLRGIDIRGTMRLTGVRRAGSAPRGWEYTRRDLSWTELQRFIGLVRHRLIRQGKFI